MNSVIQLIENRKDGAISDKFIVTDRQMEEVQKAQYVGGFKRFDIDLWDEVEQSMKMQDLREYNNFKTKIGI